MEAEQIPVEPPDEEPTEPAEPTEPGPDEEEEAETEVQPEPEPEPSEDEPQDEPEGRCEAETSAGGTAYRCSLDAGHEGEHRFQPLDASDDGDEGAADLEAFQRSRKKIEGYVTRYEKALREELGDEFAALISCPLCPEETPGFLFPMIVGQMTDEQRVAVRLVIGDAELPDYSEDTHRHRCQTCDGWGRVLTGSRKAQQDVLDCMDCGGKGFRQEGRVAAPPAGTEPQAEVVSGPWVTDEPAAPAEPDTDPWGTPPGAPYYGVLLNLRPEGWEAEVAAYKLANGIE
ncbi:MAG TPA: hypothetical protein VKA83_24300 [Methylomirabilota bacterium]|nr:hypothetical protein [Methylomirabilota bacterium]